VRRLSQVIEKEEVTVNALTSGFKILAVATATLAPISSAVLAGTAAASPTRTSMQMGTRTATPSADPLRARFVFLSHQTSNRCTLQPAEVMRMAPTARLQGSCCAPMAYADYVKQIRGLKAYADVREIPPDPYNVEVRLAQRLFGFDKTYSLDADQQAVYDQAMRMADEHDPCCCRCWRYVAFRGQAKELLARRRYTAAQIAHVWDLEDGCGSGPMMMR
jgi:hypothetical protein